MIGIIGGMGPRASSAFLYSIYTYEHSHERYSPSVIMYSVPTAPDRTAAIAGQGVNALISHLQHAGDVLINAGANSILIACVTAHAFIPSLSPILQKRIVSLIDVAFEELINQKRSLLMLSSGGTRHARLFESHPLWPSVRHKVMLPTAQDQIVIERMIGSLKARGVSTAAIRQLQRLLAKYSVDGFLAACTEFHLLNTQFTGRSIWSKHTLVDPLEILAKRIASNAK